MSLLAPSPKYDWGRLYLSTLPQYELCFAWVDFGRRSGERFRSLSVKCFMIRNHFCFSSGSTSWIIPKQQHLEHFNGNNCVLTKFMTFVFISYLLFYLFTTIKCTKHDPLINSHCLKEKQGTRCSFNACTPSVASP